MCAVSTPGMCLRRETLEMKLGMQVVRDAWEAGEDTRTYLGEGGKQHSIFRVEGCGAM